MSFLKRFPSITVIFLALPVALGLLAMAATPAQAVDCGGVQTSFNFGCPDHADAKSGDLNQSPVFGMLFFILNMLGIGIGVAAAGFIIWGAIVYMSAGGSADQVKQGISYIRNAIIGLVMYMLMFAAANYLIPGGIFSQ